MMKLSSIQSHCHQGKRDYQEDHFESGDHFILVCDGVGGLAKGNIASETVARIWRDYLSDEKSGNALTEANIQDLANKSIDKLNLYAQNIPESYGMGTTLACLAVKENEAISIHIGDSRVYHFGMDGTLKWKSKDHSLVQELIDAGIITEKEAEDHPRKNVITRVLQAKPDHKAKASVHQLANVETGDIFLVCSDGVIESWSDDGLSSVLMGHTDLAHVKKIIGDHCALHSSDNNTLVMARIDNVPDNSVVSVLPENAAIDQEAEEVLPSVTAEIDDKNPAEATGTENIHLDQAVSKENDTVEDLKSTETKTIPSWQPEAAGKKSYKKLFWLLAGMMVVTIAIFRFFNPELMKQTENKTAEDTTHSTTIPVTIGEPKQYRIDTNTTQNQDKNLSDTAIRERTDIVIANAKTLEDSLFLKFRTKPSPENAQAYLDAFPQGKNAEKIRIALEKYKNRKVIETDKENQKSDTEQ